MGKNKEMHATIARKYEDIPETILAAKTEKGNHDDEHPDNFKKYPSGSSIKFRRGLSALVVANNIYLHSGIVLQVKNSKEDEEPMVIELVNSDKNCSNEVYPLGTVVKRGDYSLNYCSINNSR